MPSADWIERNSVPRSFFVASPAADGYVRMNYTRGSRTPRAEHSQQPFDPVRSQVGRIVALSPAPFPRGSPMLLSPGRIRKCHRDPGPRLAEYHGSSMNRPQSSEWVDTNSLPRAWHTTDLEKSCFEKDGERLKRFTKPSNVAQERKCGGPEGIFSNEDEVQRLATPKSYVILPPRRRGAPAATVEYNENGAKIPDEAKGIISFKDACRQGPFDGAHNARAHKIPWNEHHHAGNS